jgi:hydrogenase maturation protease
VTPDLLIGIGNPLRGDDGVGALLVEELLLEAQGPVAGLREEAFRVVHQLTPELALAVAGAGRVLFVDAWANPDRSEAWIEPLTPRREGEGAHLGGHGWGPLAVVALADQLYGWRGEAALLRVPAFAFPHGRQLSEELKRGLPRARALVRGWLRGGGL